MLAKGSGNKTAVVIETKRNGAIFGSHTRVARSSPSQQCRGNVLQAEAETVITQKLGGRERVNSSLRTHVNYTRISAHSDTYTENNVVLDETGLNIISELSDTWI